MVFRDDDTGPGISRPDHVGLFGGTEGQPIAQDRQKIITRVGAASVAADYDISNHDLVNDGDYSTGNIDVGGTSGIAVRLYSESGDQFEVMFRLLDDDGGELAVVDDTDFSSLSGTDIASVYPVYSDHIEIVVTDISGTGQNVISGSINVNIGTPTKIVSEIDGGEVSLSGGDIGLLDSAESEIDPLTQAPLESVGDDELRVLVYDSAGTQTDPLAEAGIEPATVETASAGQSNAAVVDLGAYRNKFDIYFDSDGQSTMTVEVSKDGNEWYEHETVSYDSANQGIHQFDSAFQYARAYANQNLDRIDISAKGVN